MRDYFYKKVSKTRVGRCFDTAKAKEEITRLGQLGWSVNTENMRIMESIPSSKDRSGSSKYKPMLQTLRGVSASETIMPRAMGRKNSKLKKVNIAVGRKCQSRQRNRLKLRIVVDKSGSMNVMDSSSSHINRLDRAKAIAASWWLEMDEIERKELEVYTYNEYLRKINMRLLGVQSPNGQTDLNVLAPKLKAAKSDERWLVLTDGLLPSVNEIPKETKLAIVSLLPVMDEYQDDPRFIDYSEDNAESRRVLKQALRQLLR
jgi:hypothetical protein